MYDCVHASKAQEMAIGVSLASNRRLLRVASPLKARTQGCILSSVIEALGLTFDENF